MLCALAASNPAVAAPPVRFTLDYEAPATCPNEAAFVANVISRAATAERVSEPTSAESAFEVHITEHAGVARGFLLVRVASGPVSRRDVPDASCPEIVASMAAIAALVIEGTRSPPANSASYPADSDVSPSGSGAPTPESVAPVNAPTKAFRQAPPEPAPRATPARPPPSQVRPPPPRPERDVKAGLLEPTPFGWRIGLAVGATLETAVAPTLTPGLAFGLDLEPDRPGFLVPSVRLSGLYAASGVEPTNDGDARFRWWAARLAGCPVRLVGASAAVRPCLELDLGQLMGKGQDTQSPREQTLFWAALGPSIRFELELVRSVALEGQAGGRALLNRGRFLFLPDTDVHDMPPVSFGATLGVVARVP